ncbi:MAG: DegQ family serine endoprotease [Methyloligellaceae bacterium]
MTRRHDWLANKSSKLQPIDCRYFGRFVAATLLPILLILAPQDVSARGPESVADVAEKLLDAVVNISTSQTLKGSKGVPMPRVPKGSPFEEFFEDFLDRQRKQGTPRKVNSLGSGFVIDPSGIIVTNNHVIESAEEIVANFNDGTKLKVTKILGRDKKTDLALLKVEPKKPLVSVSFGDSSKMRVGDWVMAIGNPFGLGGTVTVGIISAKKRDINAGPYDEFIQTDAAINRGNSGGPLFDMEGKVIGVNTAIISPTGGSIGIGFAVPANTAVHVIDQLKQFGETRRGWLGVRIQSVSDEIAESLGLDEPKGALVASVTPKSPAETSGLKAGDVITEFNGQDVPTMRQLPRIVARTPIGETVDVKVLRNGKAQNLKVKIGRLEENEPGKKPSQSVMPDDKKQLLLGLSIAPITDELRARFKINSKVKGVIVTEVDSKSVAAQKNIKPGDVIVEVTQQEVKSPDDVAKRVDEVKKSGRKSVLLLISDTKGDLRFVAVPVGG